MSIGVAIGDNGSTARSTIFSFRRSFISRLRNALAKSARMKP
jgi:hypothetical protein